MFKRTPKVVPKKLNEASQSILASMETFTPDSPEYPALLSHLERVEALRLPHETWFRKLNPNNVALVVGNLAGILVIVAYEQKHVFVSKAQGFVLKSKN